jgi:hypothetical protein
VTKSVGLGAHLRNKMSKDEWFIRNRDDVW